MTFSCTNTWFFYPWGQPYYVNPISIVGWTVNTLFFFYLTFPTLLKLLKPLSDKSISRLIVRLCLFQSIPFYLVWEFYSADPKMVLFFTYCPIPRLPVFIIGILGGMQTLRWRGSLGYQETMLESQENAKTALWKRRTDIGGFLYVFFFLSCTCFNIFGAVTNLFIRWSNGYAQLFIVPLQLTIILGLSRSGNTSILARVCNNNKVQFLGDISMVLYLIHYDQLVYLSMLTSMLSKEDEYTLPTKVFSPSQIFFGLIAFSILFSWILLKTFVNPLAKGIKKCFFKFNQRELKLTERNKHSP